MTKPHKPVFQARLARDDTDLMAALRLRYDVFVRELGGDGPLVDHDAQVERDKFDPFYDHLVLVDETRRPGDHVVGAYRLMQADGAARAGQFYCEDEYDLTALRALDRKLLELGRSCLHPDYRGGTAMFELWGALARYVAAHEVEILFGVASFHGTDIAALAQALSLLHHRHLAPKNLRVTSRVFQPMDLMSEDQIDRPAAMRDTPALIKAYLRLGGCVGEGAYVDHAFNTTDVCLVMDTAQMSTRHQGIYTQGRA